MIKILTHHIKSQHIYILNIINKYKINNEN